VDVPVLEYQSLSLFLMILLLILILILMVGGGSVWIYSTVANQIPHAGQYLPKCPFCPEMSLYW
jgi:hypothetical protein